MAFLGFTIDSSQTVRAKMDLDKLTGSTVQAENAANRLKSASLGESAALKAVAAQADQAAAAMRRHAETGDKMLAMQRRNLVFQLNDIGVSLASGMNPLMVAVQQGSQIATIYEGGVVPALKETALMAGRAAVAFWPIGLAIGGVLAALAGLTYEFNKTGEQHVSMIDVMQAGWEMFTDAVGAAIAPMYDGLVAGLMWAWNTSAPVLKSWGNNIIGIFAGAYEHVTSMWGNLPAYLAAVGKLAWNDLVRTFERDALVVNGQTIIPGMNLESMYQPLEPHEFEAFSNTSWAQGKDYLGELGTAWDARAEEIAAARAELDTLGASAKAANDNAKTLGTTLSEAARAAKAEWDFYRGTFTGFFGDLKSGLREGKTFWEALGDAGANALDKIASRAMEMATNGIFDMLFGAVMGGITGGMGGGMFGKSASTPLGFGGTAGFYPAFPSFAGGGWTGNGPRTGGLDGMGGFLAMMHPREIVRDTTRAPANQNQSNDNYRRGDMHLHINGSNLSQAEMTAAIADALERYDRFTLPGRVNELKGNSMVVNG